MNIQQNLNQVISLTGLLYTQTGAFAEKQEAKQNEKNFIKTRQALDTLNDIEQTKDYSEVTHKATIRAKEDLLNLTERRYQSNPTTKNLEDIIQLQEDLEETRSMTTEEKDREHWRRRGLTPEEARQRATKALADERERYGYTTISGATSTWKPYPKVEDKK